jgi:hypothetical protein
VLNDLEKNLMKALSGLRRNDVIRAVALVSIAIFPLIANAHLGGGSGIKAAQDVSPVAGAAVSTAAARRDSCADQHWPFLSAGCLREPAHAVEPRLISMNGELSPNPATTGDAPKTVRTADVVRDNRPSVESKKTGRQRIATQRRERRTPNLNYAVNLEGSHISMPGW